MRSQDGERFGELGRHLSMTERRAADAEREAVNRYAVLYLADHVGDRFEACITDIHKAVLFVSLDGSGVSGIVPLSGLGPERFRYDPRRRKLVGKSSGTVHGVGDPLQVKLEAVDTTTALTAVFSRGEPTSADFSRASAERMSGNALRHDVSRRRCMSI